MPRLRATVNVTLAKTQSVDLDSADTIDTTVTSVSVAGVKAGGMYLVAMADADLDSGVLIQNPIFCEVDDVLLVRLVNPTAGGINVTAADMHIIGL